MTISDPLHVGDVLHGFCGGAFGRDSYDCRRIEALGADWVVCRTTSGTPNFASNRTALTDLVKYREDFTFCDHEEPWQL